MITLGGKPLRSLTRKLPRTEKQKAWSKTPWEEKNHKETKTDA